MARNYKDFTGSKNPNFKTGLKIKGSADQGIYNSWQNMKGRCLRKNNPKYHRYGGRGIKIFEPWLSIENFYEWAKSNGWETGKSIDRIDNDGDYTPENCRWISQSENSRKKRTTKIKYSDAIEIRKRVKNGESEHELAREYGVVHGTVWFIVNNITHVPEGECIKEIKRIRKRNAKTKADQKQAAP